MQVVLLLLLALAGANAFRLSPQRVATHSLQSSTRRMAIDPSDISGEPDLAGDLDPDDPKLFDMNKRVRLGRSRDQDGKSNIWSIEPRMEVEESNDGSGSSKKNLFIVGAVIGAAIISLPLFQAFSSLVPDPADF